MRKRALISVFDKTGIVDFVSELVSMGWEIISTGGTSKELKNAGISIIEIAEITKFPECLDGRLKTLHPAIHGGLLAVRENESHMKQLEELGIGPIDMVVNNLYPFKETLLRNHVKHDEIIENIDIGGPTMLRAAAKNYQYVSVIVDPKDYSYIIEEMRNLGEICLETKQFLAAKVFQYTSSYDILIAEYFNKINNIEMPDLISFTFELKEKLRYGENPHQQAAFYVQMGDVSGTLAVAEQIHGKELSFNNINDANGAIETLKEFDAPTIVAVKHTNPCGIGSASTISEAYNKAYMADPQSIFGGIIASNCEIDEATAKMINEIFIEVVIAPSYSKTALEILQNKKNIRILVLPDITRRDYPTFHLKKVLGGLLVQGRNNVLLTDEIEVITKRQPTKEEMEDLLFAWKAVKHIKSNGIVLAKNLGTLGIGPGQVSRIWALENAIKQAGERARGSVCASDAFFPFSDSVESAAKAGITAIIQPGGSIKDQDSIDAANQHNIAMVFTGIRHFKH